MWGYRYRTRERWADALRGRLDGRRGVPALPEKSEVIDGAPRIVDTPRIGELNSRASEAMTGVQTDTARSIASREAAVSEAEGRLRIAREKLNRATALLTEADRGDGLDQRRLAELDSPEELVRARRLSERHAARQRAEAAYFAALQEHANAEHVVEARNRDLEVARDELGMWVRSVRAHFARRIYRYWQGIIACHPEGAVLNTTCRPREPELPKWVQDDHHDPRR
jgi:hypothetical protein